MCLRDFTILLIVTELLCFCNAYNCPESANSELILSVGRMTSQDSLKEFNKTTDSIKSDKYRNFYNIYNGNMTLSCYKYNPLCNETPTNFTWEIMQHETNLVINKIIMENTIKAVITIGVDRYDDKLLVACTGNDNKNNTVTVKFDFKVKKLEKNTYIDYYQSEVLEGRAVRNDYGQPAILYDSGKFIKIIEHGQNIYDAVTVNNTLNSTYSIWSTIKIYETPYLSKKWFKHYVKTNPSNENINRDPAAKQNSLEQNTTLPFAVAGGAIGLLVAVFLSIYIYKKYCNKKETVNELYEQYDEHVYEEPNLPPQVLYTEVALQAPNKPAPARLEAPYATIVGKMVKKKPPSLPIRHEQLQTRTEAVYTIPLRV